MVLLICMLAGPCLGWRLYGGWQGAAMGAAAGTIVGGLLQVVMLVATLQMQRGWFRRGVGLLLAGVGVAALIVGLSPPRPGETFLLATGVKPDVHVKDMQAAWDWNDPRGYYFRFAADEAGLLAVVNKMELIPADAFSDTPPPGAPSWWQPPRGPGARCWTRRDGHTAVQLSESGGVAFLLMQIRAN